MLGGKNCLTYRYILLTALTAKATNESIDILSLQAGDASDGAYDARSLCSRVVYKFQKDFLDDVLDRSNEDPLVNNPGRHLRLSKENKSAGGDPKKALYMLCDNLPQIADSQSARECLDIVEIADFYGFEFGYNDDFAYIEPTRAFFAEGIERWSRAYAEMSRNEEAFREDYELWKDEFHGHFSKQDYPAVYPDYDPMRPDSKQRWLSDRFAAALKDMRRIYGFKQEELAERADLSLFTLRSYEQGKRMPRAKQMEALCEALGITSTVLTKHYFGSPNQAIHYLFAIAGAANLTPEKDEETGPRLRTQGNMVEWAFVCLTDKLEELKGKPATERHDELTHWLATFDCTDDDTMRDARAAGRLSSNNAKLFPKA